MRFKLSPPWITYVNMIRMMFGPDPEVQVAYDNNSLTVKLFVENEDKANCIGMLLPKEYVFGKVTLKVLIIPANRTSLKEVNTGDVQYIFDTAFAKNPVYSFTKVVQGVLSNKIAYVVFKNKVVQFFNDNLDDIHGLMSTLYETIAETLFENSKLQYVHYNTDVEEKVGMPLGEWP